MLCKDCSAYFKESCLLEEESYMTSYGFLGCRKQKRTIERDLKEADVPVTIDKCVCPVCKKEFVKDETHKFILKEGYTCSWECFRRRVKGEG